MSAALGPGAEFAGHRIERELGRGGMGVVYLARHIALDTPRALKVLPPELTRDERFVARFRRESRLAASIEHPNVVTVHHAGEEDGLLYLAMAYVEGSDLQRSLAGGPLQPARAAAIVADVGAALDAAHASGLIHRDVKPANVLLADDGDAGPGRAFLTDFGISKAAGGADTAETSLTTTGAVLGTADYMSPEQVEGAEVGGAADTYALACVAFHALTGAPPFRRETSVATLMAHAQAQRPRASAAAPGIDPAVDAVLAAAMAIDPAERPPSAGRFAEELTAALGGSAPERRTAPVAAAAATHRLEPSGPEPSEQGWGLRHFAAIAVAAGFVALLLALLVFGAGEAGEDQRPEPAVVDAEATIPVGREPNGISVGDKKVWVASSGADAVFGIVPGEGSNDRDPAKGVPGAKSVSVAFGSVWAVGSGVHKLNPGSDGNLEIGGFEDPAAVAATDGGDERGVWVVDRPASGPGVVRRIDASNPTAPSPSVPVGAEPRAVATGEGFVWVANADDGTVTKVDPIELDPVGRPIPAGDRPTNIAVGAGSVWVTDVTNGEILQIDPQLEEVVGDPIRVGARPRGIAVGGGSVWVASGAEDSVWEIDARTLQLVEPIRLVGDDPADVAFGAGSVWTANSGDGTVSRIDP